MYNWKDTRNYRRFRDENGNVIANIIYVDGEEVAVSDEVYEAYASMDRRERYLEERDNDDKPLSVDALLEEGYSEAALCSAENLEDMIADKLLVKRLHAVLETLDPADREMIHAVFFDGLSMREYAKQLDVISPRGRLSSGASPESASKNAVRKNISKIFENLLFT